MRIGELARRSGVNAKTIRFYGELGLLPPRGRTSGGYRLYDESALEQLRSIRVAQEAGLSLAEIRELFPIMAGREIRCRDMLPLLERKRRDVEGQLRRLEHLREYLEHSIGLCRRAQRKGPFVSCPVFTRGLSGKVESTEEEA